jgi:dolichyl-phosphate-mannose-protein mannosyltransferase
LDFLPRSPLPIADPRQRQRVALAIALILLLSAALRLWQLSTPPNYMFDEVYYAKDAKAIVDGRVGTHGVLPWEAGDEVSWPHPEMGKFAIAAGIIVFGDRAFGWRLPAVLAGLGILACVYPLGRRLGLPPSWALLALVFAAADTLGITQSRIATLDVFVAAWSVLCVLLALRYAQDGRRKRWLILCGAAGGMALGTKWSGALALVAAAAVIFALWLRDLWGAGVAHKEPPGEGTPDSDEAPFALQRVTAALVAALPVVGALVLLPVAFYLASYTQYFAVGHTWADWWELQHQMFTFNLHLKATHTYASKAPTWIVDYRPVWYYFVGRTTYRGVIAIGNPFLWWAATLALVAAPVLALLRRTALLLPAAALIVVLYFPWFAASRTSFLYYMTPVAPFMAILVATALWRLHGQSDIRRRGWLVLAGAVTATELLWLPVGRFAEWVFWTMPHRARLPFPWAGVGIGIAFVVLIVIILFSPRLRPARPLIVMALAGMIVGIAVAFLPIVLAMPISPDYFAHITWFPSWI